MPPQTSPEQPCRESIKGSRRSDPWSLTHSLVRDLSAVPGLAAGEGRELVRGQSWDRRRAAAQGPETASKDSLDARCPPNTHSSEHPTFLASPAALPATRMDGCPIWQKYDPNTARDILRLNTYSLLI